LISKHYERRGEYKVFENKRKKVHVKETCR